MCGDKGFWSTLHVMTVYIKAFLYMFTVLSMSSRAHVHNVHVL